MRTPLFLVMLAVACGGKTDAPVDASAEASANGHCCKPSAAPACCMQYGGWSDDGVCGSVCDGMPVPSADWKLTTDAHGCSVWTAPTTGPLCGAPPPADAAPPPICPTPADVSSFTPPAYKPPKTDATACTAAQVDAFNQDCFSPQTYNATKCAADHTTFSACASCLESQETDATWGALVVTGSIVTLNIGGCVALSVGSASCAATIESTFECELAACEAQCPISGGSSFQDYTTCIQLADQGGCAKYVAAECGLDAGACSISTFADGFHTYAKLFCGGN